MKTSKAVRSLRSLSDKEIEGCVDGATSIPMLKDIFSLPNVINKDGFIFTDLFADRFAKYLEGFLDGEIGSDEWVEADNINYAWGLSIACNINELLSVHEYVD
jgi:hypothetical protein